MAWQCLSAVSTADGGLRRSSAAPGRRLCKPLLLARRLFRKAAISAQDRRNETVEAVFQLRAARVIAHFHAVALGADKARLAQYLDMLGQRRFGDHALAEMGKRRACAAGADTGDLCENR